MGKKASSRLGTAKGVVVKSSQLQTTRQYNLGHFFARCSSPSSRCRTKRSTVALRISASSTVSSADMTISIGGGCGSKSLVAMCVFSQRIISSLGGPLCLPCTYLIASVKPINIAVRSEYISANLV